MEGSPLAPILARYREHGDLLALLKEAQAARGGLTEGVLAEIAGGLAMEVGTLYGIVSFYSFLSREHLGQHTVKLCRCVPCRMNGAEAVQGAVEAALEIKPGETTADGRFTLQLTNCVGACGKAPAMMVDDRRFGELTEASVAGVLAAFDGER